MAVGIYHNGSGFKEYDKRTDISGKINYTDALSLEEIEASTDLNKKVGSAQSVKDLNSKINTRIRSGKKGVAFTNGIAYLDHNFGFDSADDYILIFQFHYNSYIPCYAQNQNGNVTKLNALSYNTSGQVVTSFSATIEVTYIAVAI